jgi:hypothetical protein
MSGNSVSLLTEEQRLRVFENRVPKRIFRSSRETVLGGRKFYIKRNFIICNMQLIKLDITQVELQSMDGILRVEDSDKLWALVNTVIHIRVLQRAFNLMTFYVQSSF